MTGGPWAFSMVGAGAEVDLVSMSAADAHMEVEARQIDAAIS